jgi:phosphomannomutase
MCIPRDVLLGLQNGSDIRGIAIGGGKQPVTMTPKAANVIAMAFVRWLAAKTKKPPRDLKIGVGRDSRASGLVLSDAVIRGITAQGAQSFNCALATTPSMFLSTIYPQTAFDGAIMITGSFLPPNRNGMKFFTSAGGFNKEDITDLLCDASTLTPRMNTPPQAQRADIISLYINDLREKICREVNAENKEKPLDGLRVVVDASNGVGGFFVDRVLTPLGADTSGSLFLEPDGAFPNHVPNPEDKKAMAALCEATLAANADLGVIFDPDVDRMSAVLSDGVQIRRDSLIALVAAIIAPEYPGGTIVTDSVTSDRLTWFLEDYLHFKHRRFRRGYKNVINEAVRLNEEGVFSPLAIETSGHGAFIKNYFLDDGAYLAIKLLIAAANAKWEGKNLSSLIADFPRAFDPREYRIEILREDYGRYGREILSAFEQRARAAGFELPAESFEGVRLSFHTEEMQGWLLLRLSLHGPALALNIEGVRENDADRILEAAQALLEGFPDLSPAVLS